MSELEDLELIRRRWCRLRHRSGLADPSSEDFGSGGLGRVLPGASVRLLVLPADLRVWAIEFDSDFRAWWMLDGADPATGQHTRWGDSDLVTSDAAVRYLAWGEHGWSRYLGLHRHGGLEMGVGREVRGEYGGQRFFRLSRTVHRIWSALSVYQSVLERFLTVQSPWEVSLALIDVEGTVLTDVAEGWENPLDPGVFDYPACLARNLLGVREVLGWASPDGVRSLAFSLGGWIENAWASSQRRFIARSGDHVGRFNQSAAVWR